MENKIRINLANNTALIAELYDENDGRPEIVIYVENYIEKDDITTYQDICLVRPHENFNYIQENDSVDCIVWANENNECFTDKFLIQLHKEEE